MTTSPTTTTTTTTTLIVGAGFGGLALGALLKRRGEDDFTIIERADEVGGTWRDNRYPGAACDIPSHLYSFSFRPNPDWSHVFSPGPEILDYLKETAREEGLYEHVVFDAPMERAWWVPEEARWHVATPAGEFVAQFLVTATGHLSDPKLPDIPGLESFTGEVFHSARWDQDADLSGKRVAVVGTGASAIQIVPELAKVAGNLTVFQRTPAWIGPRVEDSYTQQEKTLFRRDPAAMKSLRDRLFWNNERTFAARRGIPEFLEEGRGQALDHLRRQVPDPELREKLTPNYELGCKRRLMSNTFYPALQQPNVELEASALESVEGSTLKAASGETYEADVIVFATGFETTEPPYAALVENAAGETLADQWSRRGMQAFHSTTVANFPNLFSINGPNTSLGHNSIVHIIESQAAFVLGALDHIRAQGAEVITTREDAESAYVDEIDEHAMGTVWLEGNCDSWYVDPRSGKLTTIWPDFAYAFRDENGEFDPEGYEFAPAPAASAAS